MIRNSTNTGYSSTESTGVSLPGGRTCAKAMVNNFQSVLICSEGEPLPDYLPLPPSYLMRYVTYKHIPVATTGVFTQASESRVCVVGYSLVVLQWDCGGQSDLASVCWVTTQEVGWSSGCCCSMGTIVRIMPNRFPLSLMEHLDQLFGCSADSGF